MLALDIATAQLTPTTLIATLANGQHLTIGLATPAAADLSVTLSHDPQGGTDLLFGHAGI